MSERIIKVNDDFEFYSDRHQWILTQFRDGTSKEGDAIRVKSETFYPNLQQVCGAIIDRSCGECEDLQSIINLLENAKDVLKEHIQRE